jgi:dCMP deaminase
LTNRPSWTNHFLAQAFITSIRSPDSQTKCGCVIVDKETKIILGQGYNGFPRGLKDEILPDTRPEKYAWMIHAEVNAILNCCERPEGAIAYVTTRPCFNCMLMMWQAGIEEVNYALNGSKPQMIDNQEYADLSNTFINMSGMKINGVIADLSTYKDFILNMQE